MPEQFVVRVDDDVKHTPCSPRFTTTPRYALEKEKTDALGGSTWVPVPTRKGSPIDKALQWLMDGFHYWVQRDLIETLRKAERPVPISQEPGKVTTGAALRNIAGIATSNNPPSVREEPADTTPEALMVVLHDMEKAYRALDASLGDGSVKRVFRCVTNVVECMPVWLDSLRACTAEKLEAEKQPNHSEACSHWRARQNHQSVCDCGFVARKEDRAIGIAACEQEAASYPESSGKAVVFRRCAEMLRAPALCEKDVKTLRRAADRLDAEYSMLVLEIRAIARRVGGE